MWLKENGKDSCGGGRARYMDTSYICDRVVHNLIHAHCTRVQAKVGNLVEPVGVVAMSLSWPCRRAVALQELLLGTTGQMVYLCILSFSCM